MTLQEKALYHQIHPIELGTDIISALIPVYFLWIHNMPVALGLAVVLFGWLRGLFFPSMRQSA